MAAVSIAPALLWRITHRRNSFLVRRDGVRLSTHPANPTGIVRRQYDGFSNLVSLNVSGNDAKGLTVTVSRPNNKIPFEQVAFNDNPEDARELNIKVRALAESVGRPDLQTVLSRRITRVHRILHDKPAFPAKRWSGRVSAQKAALRERQAEAREKQLAIKKAKQEKAKGIARAMRKRQRAQKEEALAKLEAELQAQKSE